MLHEQSKENDKLNIKQSIQYIYAKEQTLYK